MRSYCKLQNAKSQKHTPMAIHEVIGSRSPLSNLNALLYTCTCTGILLVGIMLNHLPFCL